MNRNIYALMEKQLARKDAKLEAEEKENADQLEAGEDKVFQLQSEARQLEVNQLVYKCEDCVERERNYKELDDLNNQKRETSVCRKTSSRSTG